MFWLSIIILYARGAFNRHKKAKKIMAFVLFAALIISELRFGTKLFFAYFLTKIAYTFVFFLSLFFLQVYIFNMFEAVNFNKKLDVHNFPKLKKRDAEWLAAIINGEKYEYLAIKYQISLGAVKNRLKIIFDELEVGDKRGFLTKYSDYEIYYGDDFSSFSKNKFFNI